MSEAGKKTNAGQEVRIADIEADAGKGMGMFENLHDYASAAALAQGFKEAANQYHGTIGIDWLKCVAKDWDNLPAVIRDGIGQFVAENVPAGASGQVKRVARRFALVAVAGELAGGAGLTGWREGQADDAARACFASWLNGFGGTGNHEERALLQQVRAFFEAHGDSRFGDAAGDDNQAITNRAGYRRTNPETVR